MLRAHRVIPAGRWPRDECRGIVTLAFDDRHRRRLRLTMDDGGAVLLDLAQAAMLGDGDGLALREGGYVAVRAALEDLVEVRAPTPGGLTRIAWHVGNRHCPAELRADCILIRNDHVLVAMVEGLGATVRRVRAPFNPEGGAYGNAAPGGRHHGRGRHDDHVHDHDHDH
jgi:urease accessory protein